MKAEPKRHLNRSECIANTFHLEKNECVMACPRGRALPISDDVKIAPSQFGAWMPEAEIAPGSPARKWTCFHDSPLVELSLESTSRTKTQHRSCFPNAHSPSLGSCPLLFSTHERIAGGAVNSISIPEYLEANECRRNPPNHLLPTFSTRSESQPSNIPRKLAQLDVRLTPTIEMAPSWLF